MLGVGSWRVVTIRPPGSGEESNVESVNLGNKSQESRLRVWGEKQVKSPYRYQEDYVSTDMAIQRTLAGILNQKGKHKRFQDSGETWPNLLKKESSWLTLSGNIF